MNWNLIAAGLGLISLLSAIGCGDNSDRIKQNAQIQSEEAAKKSVEADNSNREKRVSELEADLQKRQLVYHAVAGAFEGLDPKNYQSRFVLTPSLPFYKPDRVRTIEEVDLSATPLLALSESVKSE
jgi:hypothetical protein